MCVSLFRPRAARIQDNNYLCSKEEETEALKDEASDQYLTVELKPKVFPVLRNSRIVDKWDLSKVWFLLTERKSFLLSLLPNVSDFKGGYRSLCLFRKHNQQYNQQVFAAFYTRGNRK